MRSTAAEQRGTGIRTHLRAYSESLRGRARPRDFVSRLCAAPLAAQRGRDSLWIPIIFKGLLRAEKGWGSSLYRLPAFCHRDRLIHAGRFFRKEKSSFLRAERSPAPHWGFCAEPARSFLRRSLCAAYGDEFFLYEKMGRRAIDHEGSTSEEGPPPPKKFMGIQGGLDPRCVVKRRIAEAWGQRPQGLALRSSRDPE